MSNSTDQQAAQEVLDANPGMLWQKATHNETGQMFAARHAGDHYEVLLQGSDGEAVTIWEKWHFALRFSLVGHLDPTISSQLDAALFSGMLNGNVRTETVS